MLFVLMFGVLLCVLFALLFYRLREEFNGPVGRGTFVGLAVASLLYGVLLGVLVFKTLAP
ncbi:MAG TPA: hypothetical protein VN626_01210 [Clostridia bacterium]|nr:hypothetical protein [Clostridia bacterium]